MAGQTGTGNSDAHDAAHARVTVPVDRGRALTRAVLFGAGAGLLLATALAIYVALDWGAAGRRRWLIHYSAALLALPFPVCGLAVAWIAVRWLMLVLWPGRLGMIADARSFTLALGPFRTRSYPADELIVVYPFERVDEETDPPFESLLPEEHQLRRHVPRILHASSQTAIHESLLKFGTGGEAQIARMLRPVLRVWRPDLNWPQDEE